MTHRDRWIITVQFLLLSLSSGLSGGAIAGGDGSAVPAPPTMEHPARQLQVLSLADIDPARLLPPPPAEGSERQIGELAETQRAYRSRTAERLSQAQWDDQHEDRTIFREVLGAEFDLAHLPETAKLLDLVENEQSVAATLAKRYFHRPRPWTIDRSITPCDAKPNANPNGSYPSGHATLGYSLAAVLAALMPDRAPTIQARASDYAYSREICGAHFPSDLEAGHALGLSVAITLLHRPALLPQVDAARAELQSAHLTRP